MTALRITNVFQNQAWQRTTSYAPIKSLSLLGCNLLGSYRGRHLVSRTAVAKGTLESFSLSRFFITSSHNYFFYCSILQMYNVAIKKAPALM